MPFNEGLNLTRKHGVDTVNLRFRDEPALWRNFLPRPVGYIEDLFAKGEVSPALRASA